ncbi:36178_t:CDS:1, partial [Racocetra persica]
ELSKILNNEKILTIQDDDDISTIYDDEELIYNNFNQDILKAFNKVLFFLKHPPNNLEISQLEIESVKSLYEKTSFTI